ncbi:PcfJ domain-containing protein [Aporhodopirellula aestuarii]|uniref:PcfJ domain-containing protein n=1 Tax=Aporhodopirellula aestuarii TaxID=2950107 RepID=A0ABT0UCI2_9BACT|nr:PcfJ domain-containing protein [Aporhodopirellula aestuarii]MCM2374439.1 PcfJ domain-containing protein [Aporhodopirellula aestuarii]
MTQPVKAFCQQRIAAGDPKHLKVQKAIFAASCGVPKIAHDERLYENRYLVSDILRFRAAAAVVAYATEIVWSRWRVDPARINDVDAFECFVLKELQNWQRLISPTWFSYGSLRRTVMNLPGGVPARLLPMLAQKYLKKPITDRVVLTTLLLATEYLDLLNGPAPTEELRSAAFARVENVELFMHATRQEIADAVVRVGEALQTNLSLRRTADIQQAVAFLLEYPYPHQGRLGGLARKSIKWHRNRGWEQITGGHDGDMDRNQMTQKPPIDLPDSKGIRLLESAGEIYDEGARMHHCVARFVDHAITGRHYIFHVDYACSRATVMVDPSGRIVEAQGPCNQENVASRYGRSVLQAWGKRLEHR